MTLNEARKKTIECNVVLAVTSLLICYFTEKPALLVAAIFFLTAGFVFKSIGAVVSWAWLSLGLAIGAVMSRVVLTLLYYVVLTPLALCYRILNRKKTMCFRPSSESFFFERDYTYSSKDLERLW